MIFASALSTRATIPVPETKKPRAFDTRGFVNVGEQAPTLILADQIGGSLDRLTIDGITSFYAQGADRRARRFPLDRTTSTMVDPVKRHKDSKTRLLDLSKPVTKFQEISIV